jgi:transcriptional regulator GlxA family with amidase domain
MRAANLLERHTLFSIRHIAVYESRVRSSCGVEIKVSTYVGENVDFDIVFVVAAGSPANFKDARTFSWLKILARRGVTLAGVSGGPIILVAAGVMDNYRMTVHWEHAELLNETSPNLLVSRTLYLVDRDRITCAGGIAPLDLMHSLITEYYGEDLAQRVSDWFMHTDIRPSGGPQRAGITARYRTNSGPVVVAIESMENHIADPLSLSQLALVTNVSERQLNRLFGQELGQSTMGFYRFIRLETAQIMLRSSSLLIQEIAFATGFSSATHFSQCFKKHYKKLPGALRKAGANPTQEN